jgi:hypothetical protein
MSGTDEAFDPSSGAPRLAAEGDGTADRLRSELAPARRPIRARGRGPGARAARRGRDLAALRALQRLVGDIELRLAGLEMRLAPAPRPEAPALSSAYPFASPR